MKGWYQNRMEQGVKHRNFDVPKDKYVYLTPKQSLQHNKNGKEERVAKVDNPPQREEVAVLTDWDEYQKSLKAESESEVKEAEVAPQKEETSRKNNRRGK